MIPEQLSEYVDLNEAAVFFGAHYVTMARWARSGRIPGVIQKPNRQWKIPREFLVHGVGRKIPSGRRWEKNESEVLEAVAKELRRLADKVEALGITQKAVSVDEHHPLGAK